VVLPNLGSRRGTEVTACQPTRKIDKEIYSQIEHHRKINLSHIKCGEFGLVMHLLWPMKSWGGEFLMGSGHAIMII
jgi:hypothetical protein